MSPIRDDAAVEEYYDELLILEGEQAEAGTESLSVEDAYEELVILCALERTESEGDVEGYYDAYEVHYARPGEAEAFSDLEHSFFAAGEALEREAEAAPVHRPRRRATG